METTNLNITLLTPAELFDKVVKGGKRIYAYSIYHKDRNEITMDDIRNTIFHTIGATGYYPVEGGKQIYYAHFPAEFWKTKKEFCKEYDAIKATFIYW